MFLALWPLLVSAQPWIIGGVPSLSGAWPGVVAVQVRGEPRCTGVLVAPRVALTAAHCAEGLEAVILDTLDPTRGGRVIAAEEVVAYPNWATTLDVALVRLAEDAAAPYYPLALDCESLYEVGATAFSVGYGRVTEAAIDDNHALHEVRLSVTDPRCEALDAGCNEAVSPGGELRAGGEGLDTCTGDSGGPLFVVGEGGALWLAGLTSRASAPATTPCGSGGIYTRLDAAAPWIEATAGITLARPDCGVLNTAPDPEDQELRLGIAEVRRLWIDPRDAEGGGFDRQVLSDNCGVHAVFDAEGWLHLAAAPTFVGECPVSVEICDQGWPPKCGEAQLLVEVQGGEGGCDHLGASAFPVGAVGLLMGWSYTRGRRSRRWPAGR